MKCYSKLAFLGLAALIAFAPAARTEGQDWPSKPVTVVVASAAGGSADVLTRIVLNHLHKAAGANFVVVNRPGAAGTIGMGQLARAQPDGYTLGYGNITTLAVNPSLFTNLSYDVRQSFEPVGHMFSTYNVMVVPADSPFKSVSDLIAYARKQPGKLSYAGAGVGSSGHMAGELFKKMAGVDVLFIPYNGDPASLADLAGGRLDYTFTNLGTALPLVKSGKLRALAVTSLERLPEYPDLPTLDEQGLKGYENVSWGGLMFPKGTPAAIVNRTSAALKQVLGTEDLRQDLAGASASPGTLVNADFVCFIDSEQKKWAEVIRTANIPKQN